MLLGCWLLPAPAARAGENAYDLLGHLLVPYASVLLEHPASGHHAFSMAFRFVETSGLPVEATGSHGELAIQYPDKLRLHGPILGETFTVCRRGELIWVYPGSKLRALLQQPELVAKLPPPKRDYRLKPFHLPVSEKQLAFLPVLFQAQTEAPAAVAGQPCEVLGLRFSPLLGTILGLPKWRGQAWVNGQEQLVQFRVIGPETSMLLRFENIHFAAQLPPETWVPTKEEEGDVVAVPPARYDQLFRAFTGLMKE